MYPYIGEWDVYAGLAADDIAGIQSIYASTPPPPGAVTKWESVSTHGAAGDIALTMFNGCIEPRAAGLRRISLTFDQALNPATVGSAALTIVGQQAGIVSTAGATAVLSGSNTVLTFTLAAKLADCDTYTISVGPGVRTSRGAVVSGNAQIVATSLCGDANGSGSVTLADAVAIRDCTGGIATPYNAMCDIDNSGEVASPDMRLVRKLLQGTAP